MTKSRAIVLLMDSLGIGATLDAPLYGDAGANTFGHILKACSEGQADKKGLRAGSLHIPHLMKAGLYHANLASSGISYLSPSDLPEPLGIWGYAVPTSLGKDTPSGHWEIAGVPVTFSWGYFPNEPSCFPKLLIEDFIKEAQLPGVLGECHASGTDIIAQLGQEHIESGKPIVYTSADSVFQIAAHETYFSLERLDQICEIARKLVDRYHVGRVIARPFEGQDGQFYRTGNRRDYSIPPPAPTLLDDLKAAGREVVAIGKTADIFAHSGVTELIKADGNMALFDATITALDALKPGGLIFTNFVDFDSSYGHRRDVAGYAHALEAFDEKLSILQKKLHPDDVVVITADHGCDPTFPGSNHTREHIPVILFGQKIPPRFVGRRDSFADIGQSLATLLAISPLSNGVSFL